MMTANRISAQCRHLWFIHSCFDDICNIAGLDVSELEMCGRKETGVKI